MRLAPNPATRILALILLAAGQPLMETPIQVGLLAALSLATVWIGGVELLGRTIRGLLRLRWLLISILGLYLFVDPVGTDLRWPDATQALTALTRLLPLVLVLTAANLLLATTPVERLSAGIHGFLQPLRMVGLPVARFSHLLALTLHAIPVQAERLQATVARAGSGMEGIAASGARLLSEAEAGTVTAGVTMGAVDGGHPPEPDVPHPVELAILAGALVVLVATSLP